jgi:carboxymethylenebutenolidase
MLPRFLVVASLFASACTFQRWQPSRSTAMDDHMAHMSEVDLRAPAVAPGSIFSERQGTPGLPPSAVTAEARLKASPRHAEWVKIAWEPGSKDSLMAWVVYPAARGKAPVVVVVHEIFGLSTWVRGVADQLAADGFVAIAPDLESRVRGGPSTTELSGDSARKIIGDVGFAERNRGIIAAATYAMSQPAAERRYGVVGYCWGGSTAFGHAVSGGTAGFGGSVAYYGTPFMNGSTVIADSVAKIRVPTMLLNGSLDPRITPVMPAIDSIMRAQGKTYSGTNYEGAIHGFLRAQDDPTANNGPPNLANLAAAKDAWPKTVAFFRKNLGAK